jgi:hypothetical protein
LDAHIKENPLRNNELCLSLLGFLPLMRDCQYSVATTPTMREYDDHGAQAHAWAASHSSDRTHDGVNTPATIGIDWIAVSILLIFVGWICSQYYHVETGNISRTGKPFVHAIFAIVRRLATDLARFMLTILAITAELLLWGKNASLAAVRKNREEISRYTASALQPVAKKVLLRYDTANHSHRANLARQYLRALNTYFAAVLRWVAIIGVAYIILNGWPTGEHVSLADDEGRTHMFPLWVIKARPENRPEVGSSSHYRPEHEFACIQEPQGRRKVFGHHRDERNITGASRRSTPHVKSTQTWLSATRMDSRRLDSLRRVQSSTADSTGEPVV